MSRDLGRNVLGSGKLYARILWADFPFPIVGHIQFLGDSCATDLLGRGQHHTLWLDLVIFRCHPHKKNYRTEKSELIFGEGDATKPFSVKKMGFSVKRGEAIQGIRGFVRISTGKAIQ